ncbi:hypothetical protein [Pseudoclavibacter sp. JSM 162008]|uniref:hypothetical protein n=1 Tax=Pseudoclavibacter sp. JSM 162008 TaxID=3229855 RepID=UPI003523792C
MTRQYYGNELDEIPWHFDQYAPLLSASPWSICGTVASISAVYVRLALTSDREQILRPDPGSVHLEEVLTTRNTRNPQREKEQRELAKHDPPAGATGWYGPDSLKAREGDKNLTGWLITLLDEEMRPAEHWAL